MGLVHDHHVCTYPLEGFDDGHHQIGTHLSDSILFVASCIYVKASSSSWSI